MDKTNLSRLVDIMKRLRSKDGCPWDKEQNAQTLIPFVIEEAYEVVGAIESGVSASLKEELGDMLFQVVFLSELASEKNEFDIKDVVASCVEKMTRRHPHVFGEGKADTSKEVLERWHEIKKKEGKDNAGYLSGVAEALPALVRAHKVSAKAAKAGFDWQNISQVIDKIEEELTEFKAAIKAQDVKNTEEELGDMLFALVNAARFVEIDPEEALRKTIGRFMRRFHYIENALTGKNKSFSDSSIEEMEALWQEAKQKEKTA